jgi:UDP:flavonoid glycosyltransferase YjiC (YdhE family)
MIAVYRALEAVGVDARIATHGGIYEFVFEQEGVPVEWLEPRLSEEESRRYLEAVLAPHRARAYDRDSLERHVRAEISFFSALPARAVISGFTLSTALSARGAGVPLVVTHLGSLVPPVLETGMFACAECFDSPLTGPFPSSWIDRAGAWLMQRLPVHVRQFNAVACELGTAPVRGIMDLMMGDLTLVTDVPEILGISEPDLEAWRPSSRHYRPDARLAYAGPIFARLFGEVPLEVREFLDTAKPKVFVSLASTNPEHLRRVYEPLRQLDVRAVFTATVHDAAFIDAPNCLVKRFLPAHEVMPLCDLAIAHGGQGTVQTAIAGGTPLIGFPLQPEQNFNLRQVERHGAGVCMSLRSLAGGNLGPVIPAVLAERRYRESMARLKRWQGTRDGPTEVARAVKRLIAA